MAVVDIRGSNLGGGLRAFLDADDLAPGDAPDYQLCKDIFTLHPIGAKMVEAPITLAQSQARIVAVPTGPEEVAKAFEAAWERLEVDKVIFNTKRQSRMYGSASCALLVEGEDAKEPLDPAKLSKATISFNVFDPLNTAGSLVMNQDPNAFDFQKHKGITVNGKHYHRSREVTVLNEEPLFISYTGSSFGFSGRSVYQRALYPLKSFIQSMITDDMVIRKSGVLVVMMKQVGSFIDQATKALLGIKRQILKEAKTDNVINIGQDDKVETLNMQNLDGAYGAARGNVLKNCATAADMPAKLLENETLVEGFGEGTEDAKSIARYIDRFRRELRPLYSWFDAIVMRVAWSEDFYKALAEKFPDAFRGISYEEAFWSWANAFTATWPNLLEEPDSEKAKSEDVKAKTVIAVIEAVGPMVDPENRAKLIDWMQQNLNENKILFPNPLEIDTDKLRRHFEEKDQEAKDLAEQGAAEPGEDAPKPFAEAA